MQTKTLSFSLPASADKLECTVTYGPTQSLSRPLDKEEMDLYVSLLDKVQTTPKQSFDEVKAFYDNHPDLPESWNLLTYALIQKMDIKGAEKLIEDCYKQFPDYLFARINYADQLLRKKRFEEIPKIFPSFDLNVLFPEKESFHVNEMRGFWMLLAYYHLAIKDKTSARHFLELLKQIDSDHASVRYLEKKLSKQSLWKRLLNVFR